jgi:hypothetical protein
MNLENEAGNFDWLISSFAYEIELKLKSFIEQES